MPPLDVTLKTPPLPTKLLGVMSGLEPVFTAVPDTLISVISPAPPTLSIVIVQSFVEVTPSNNAPSITIVSVETYAVPAVSIVAV